MKKLSAILIILLSFSFAQVQETQKVAVIHYTVGDSGIVQTETNIVYGLPPNLAYTDGDYRADAKDSSGKTLLSFGFYDPRVSMGDEIGQEGRQGVYPKVPEAELVLVVPVSPSLAKLEIANASTNQTLVSTDLSKPIADFCKSNPTDPDCKSSQANGTSCLPMLGLAALLAALFVRRNQVYM